MSKDIKKINYMKLICFFIIATIFLASCGSAIEENEEVVTDNSLSYKIDEVTIPDPDEALRLAGILGPEDWVREINYILQNDTVYRFVEHWTGIIADGTAREYDYIQVLDAPYTEWRSYEVPSTYWDTELVGLEDPYYIEQIFAGADGHIYCRLKYNGVKGKQEYLALWSPEESGKLLCAIPEELEELEITMLPDGSFYAYDLTSRKLDKLDENMKPIQEWSLPGQCDGILQNPQNMEVFWYGVNQNGLGFWSLNANSPLREGLQNVNSVCYQAAFVANGNFYLMDKQRIWCAHEGGDLVELCDLQDMGYLLEDIYEIVPREDGGIRVLARMEGQACILILEERQEAVVEKQEIVLATWYLDNNSGIQQAISRFNRQNENYRIVMLSPQENQSDEEFINQIQLEVSTGKGPDILEDTLVLPQEYAQNGYLADVEGVISEEGDFWQAALDNCRVDGVLYGIPYECGLSYAAYSQELVASRSSWTLLELMEAVRASEVELLQPGLDGIGIVQYYGLYDNSNTTFIDWEKGESYLSEEPFLELLEFAREYADTGDYPTSQQGDMLQEGKIAAEVSDSWLDTMKQLNYLEACFAGEPACIGYPAKEGNGIFVSCRKLYLNSSSENPEGCKEFFQFLLSEESQKKYVEFGREWTGESVVVSNLSTRISVLEHSIALKKLEKANAGSGGSEIGINYSIDGFTEEQEQRFWFLIDNAKPANWHAQDIMWMVNEELQPYFSGQRTAREAAAMLDSRVQIYLDERK